MSPMASPITTYRSSGVNVARKTTFWSLLMPEKVFNTSPVVLSRSAIVFGSVARTHFSSPLFSMAVIGCFPDKVSTRNSPLRISNVRMVPSIEHAEISFVFPPPLSPRLTVKSIAASENCPTVSIASCCLFDRTSQNFTFLSNPHETTTQSSVFVAEDDDDDDDDDDKNFTQFTPNASWPVNRRVVCPVFTSQTNTPLSPPQLTSLELSRDAVASLTSRAWTPAYSFSVNLVRGLHKTTERSLQRTA